MSAMHRTNNTYFDDPTLTSPLFIIMVDSAIKVIVGKHELFTTWKMRG